MHLSANVITNVLLDKFALRTFNRFAYNWEISGPLVASYLLSLPDYYILSDNVKSINLTILWKCFWEFALHFYETRSSVNNFLQFRRQSSTPPTMFDCYCCQRSRLQNFCLFMYMRVISIYPRKLVISSKYWISVQSSEIWNPCIKTFYKTGESGWG